MENLENLKCYEGVEEVQLEQLDKVELEAYVEDKMKSAQSDVKFIECHMPLKQLSICEIGCGNGKLLYALEKRNLLSAGVGYEVADSRSRMAKKFSEILGCSRVEIKNMDFLRDDSNQKYDVIVLVDIVFQMIVPLFDNAQEEALKWIRESLNAGGFVLFELEDYSNSLAEIREKGEIRKWDEFCESDPFQYGLYKITLDTDGNIVYDKTFLKRNSYEKSENHSVWKSYTPEEIRTVLEAHGFDVQICDYYNDANEREIAIMDGTFKNNLYRVWARKK